MDVITRAELYLASAIDGTDEPLPTPVTRMDQLLYKLCNELRRRLGETYSGEYDITPQTESQNIPTANKILRQNMVVRAIPYYETANTDGTTVYIADNIGGASHGN